MMHTADSDMGSAVMISRHEAVGVDAPFSTTRYFYKTVWLPYTRDAQTISPKGSHSF